VFENLLARIAAALEANKLPYMIIGGQAVLLYGTPRLTKDIDITLGVSIDTVPGVVKALAAIGLKAIPQDFKAFVEKTFVLPMQDAETGIRVDFIFSLTPYERLAIGRAKPTTIRDKRVMFASVEDVIIHKIFAGRPRDLEDVRSIIIKNPDFDREYTTRWLTEFDRSVESGRFLETFEQLLQEIT
jgi:hypothetical protein